MPRHRAASILSGVTASLGLLLFASAPAAPDGGWGPHYQQCLPQYFDGDFSEMNPPADAHSASFEKYDDNNLLMWVKELTFWRVPCMNDPTYPATFVRVETVERGPADDSGGFWDSLSRERLRIIQDSLDSEPRSFASCSNISACGLSYVEVFDGPEIRLIPRARNSAVDLARTFTVHIEGTEGTLSVPGSEPEDDTSGIPLQGALSGSWYDPDRSGEGLVLEFGESDQGPVMTVYWFTYLDERQYWLIGSQPYTPGDTSLTLDLLEVTASGFGDEFDPDTVEQEYFGSMSIEFSSCSRAVASWESAIGLGEGEFQLRRLTGGLHGIECD